MAAGYFGGAGFTATERSAFGKQIRAGGAVNGAIDAAAAEQTTVRRIDNGVDAKRRDVGNADIKECRTDGSSDKRRDGRSGGGHNRQFKTWPSIYHAHSACASAPRSTVLFTPISSKCSSRNR